MKILVVDTTSEICGVGILEDNKLIIETALNNGLTHSENLILLIKDNLEKAKINLSEIDLLVCCTGPGSFTGIRIGIASIKAIAEVNNLKIAEVTSLESLAQNIKNISETKVSLIDARNNQCYCGIFDNNINLKENYIADDINVILERVSKYDNITFIGNGAELHKKLIISKIKNANFDNNNIQSPYACGIIGLKKFKEKKLKDADTLLPNYLRKSQAERLKNKGN